MVVHVLHTEAEIAQVTQERHFDGASRQRTQSATVALMNPGKELLDAQQAYWDTNFASRPEMFGEAPSDPAQTALQLLKAEGRTKLLELGGGQGRDTFFFAR